MTKVRGMIVPEAGMTETITAIYENGVLRPLKPLRLKEQQRVKVQLLPEDTQELALQREVVHQWLKDEDLLAEWDDESLEERQAILNDFLAAGLIEERPWLDVPDEDPVSPEERAELARLLGSVPGKPLSETIIEERGEW